MIALARAMLGAFAADRVSVVLSLLAPVAFFTLIGSFYAHLERPDGVRIEIVVQDDSGTEDGRRLADAVSTCARDPIIVRQGSAASSSGPFATIVLPARFTRREGAVEILTGVPFPGGTGLVRQLVELSAWTAFGPSFPEIPVTVESAPSRLVRDASVGICLVFMMFSVSSLASRGLADDAAGLRRRLAALGVGPLSLSGARAAVMTAVGFAQMVATFLWARLAFGVVPGSNGALLAAAFAGSFAVAGFTVFLAAACGSRPRFAAASPVIVLVLAAGSGALIPRFLLPAWAAAPGTFMFPSWAIDSSRAAMDGQFDLLHMTGLLVVGAIALPASAAVMRWRGEA